MRKNSVPSGCVRRYYQIVPIEDRGKQCFINECTLEQMWKCTVNGYRFSRDGVLFLPFFQ